MLYNSEHVPGAQPNQGAGSDTTMTLAQVAQQAQGAVRELARKQQEWAVEKSELLVRCAEEKQGIRDKHEEEKDSMRAKSREMEAQLRGEKEDLRKHAAQEAAAALARFDAAIRKERAEWYVGVPTGKFTFILSVSFVCSEEKAQLAAEALAQHVKEKEEQARKLETQRCALPCEKPGFVYAAIYAGCGTFRI